jgi:acyl carrier protein
LTRGEVFDVVVSLMRRTFKSVHLEVTDRTTANDVPGWDSLGHTTLLVRLEKHFDVRIPDAVGRDLTNVGALVDCLCALLEAK